MSTKESEAGLAPSSGRQPIRGVDNLSTEQRRAFLRGTLADWRSDTDAGKGLEAPPIQKPCAPDAERGGLVAPEKITLGGMAVRDAVGNRRSRRVFSTESFSLEELSYLLWATQGISRIERDDGGRVIAQYRTVPSGGARHPFETYLVINRVKGITPGLYRYLPVEHRLAVVGKDNELPGKVMDACYGQECAGTAAVVFIWTALPYRTEWKYGTIAQKLVAVEAGHVCQNLYLAVESIQGGARAVMGQTQALMDELVGVDGKDEFVIYLAVTGKPIEPDGER